MKNKDRTDCKTWDQISVVPCVCCKKLTGGRYGETLPQFPVCYDCYENHQFLQWLEEDYQNTSQIMV